MKKHYVNPEIQVVPIEMQGCIAAGSLGVYGDKMTGDKSLSRENNYNDLLDEDDDWDW